MGRTCLLHSFAGGKRAAEAVQTDLLKSRHGLRTVFKNIADHRLSCDFHFYTSFLYCKEKIEAHQRLDHPKQTFQACSFIFAKHSLQ